MPGAVLASERVGADDLALVSRAECPDRLQVRRGLEELGLNHHTWRRWAAGVIAAHAEDAQLSKSPLPDVRLQLGYGGFGASRVLPSVRPNMPVAHCSPMKLRPRAVLALLMQLAR